MAKSTAIVFNRRSGSAMTASELRRALAAARIDAVVHPIAKRADVARWLTGLAQEYDVLVAAGGDGTVSAVAAAASQFGKTLGVIPTGTLNHFAGDAGIPTSLEPALLVLAAGHTRRFDIGIVNGVVFINNASIGAYARLVFERNRTSQRGWPRPLATGFAMLRTWLGLRTVTVRLCIDSTEVIRRTPFLVVGNNDYEVEGLDFGSRSTLAGGRLALYVAPESGRLDALLLPFRALAGRLEAHDKFEIWRAASITMDFARPHVRIALDGEIDVLASPLRFELRRQALQTIVAADDGTP